MSSEYTALLTTFSDHMNTMLVYSNVLVNSGYG